MRFVPCIAIAVLLAVRPASAGHLVIPDTDDPAAIRYDMTQRDETPPFASERPDPGLVEQPIAEVIAARLGIAQGKVELFRYHLEGAPSPMTDMRAVVDGGGLKLKISW